ncbi:hypothetical protein AYI69_g9311 [Smittium culicis]|uniref:Uncharacterized protein n=1 Tax=Smittium culicis TaxID=133412 RepID=A0A1R1XDJ0_9FUNG|nr:hypothetical protein AYI69_g9762 [Smittium culicis]OMJ12689.1 hypothetical protein AYI69_g9311 [Smittium culicis]
MTEANSDSISIHDNPKWLIIKHEQKVLEFENEKEKWLKSEIRYKNEIFELKKKLYDISGVGADLFSKQKIFDSELPEINSPTSTLKSEFIDDYRENQFELNKNHTTNLNIKVNEFSVDYEEIESVKRENSILKEENESLILYIKKVLDGIVKFSGGVEVIFDKDFA